VAFFDPRCGFGGLQNLGGDGGDWGQVCPNPNEGRQGESHRLPIDPGLIASDDALLLQSLQPLMHSRTGQADLPSNLLLAQSSVGLKKLYNRAIDGVHSIGQGKIRPSDDPSSNFVFDLHNVSKIE
jgi:hypothetical protein